ncbi:MAG: ABC-F family ATP-binding cassette domain-containing protein [Sphingobium sp.]|nr:ABC-F family ATP-binding cassette domain-containing protein [Sphingobium sp.]
MSSLLLLDSIAAATPEGTPLFSDLTLSVGQDVVGLVGRNGAGKSTLLHIVQGTVAPLAGTVTRSGRVAMLRQIQGTEGTLADALGISQDLARLRRLEAGDGTADDAAQADWMLEARIGEALAQVRFPHDDLDRPLATLSGGERTRLALAAMLIGEPDLLLLDEPTNNLDADGREAIAELLDSWTGGALVASHDRALLEGMDRIVQISPVGIFTFGGGWSEFVEARDAQRDRAATQLDRAERDVRQQARANQKQLERKARRDKAGRAMAARRSEPKIVLGGMKRQAERTSGRGTLLAERLRDEAEGERAEARRHVEILTPLHIDLPRAGLPANRTLLRCEELVLELGGRRLFGPLNFSITGPERIVLRGRNGSGKTSLLRILAGEIAPTGGRVHRAEGTIAMLDQHVDLLDPALDLVANMQARHRDMTRGQAHDILARFAFRNRDAQRPAATLSGGERLRAGLAMLTGGATPPQMLMLDEPTNHLDIEAVEMLEAALVDYDGALLVVSHDARFVEAVGCAREIVLG